MRFITPIAVYLLAFAALIVGGSVLWVGFSFEQFKRLDATADGDCTPVVGIHGAADLEAVPDTGMVYISSFDRRGDAARGAILKFDTDDPLDSASWRDRTRGVPTLLEPMGIDLYTARLPNGEMLERLFVVNTAGPEVLLYDVQPDGDLALLERFQDLRLVSPNDVVATGPRTFYVTNDTASGRGSLRGKLDFLFGLKTGEVLHFDGERWADVASGLAFPNGLALSADGRTLYLAEMRAKKLHIFTRDPDTEILGRSTSRTLASFPNNLSVSTGGEVLIGMAPQPLALMAYGEGLRDRAPSQVVSLDEEGGDTATLFQDAGEVLSAATIGVRLRDRLLIGSRAADRILMCDAA